MNVYTDGSANGFVAAWAFHIQLPENTVIEDRGTELDRSAQWAEVMSIYQALRALIGHYHKYLEPNNLGNSTIDGSSIDPDYQTDYGMLGQGNHLLDNYPENGLVINLYTDSDYVFKTLTQYLESWKQKGWKKSRGGFPQYLALWKSIDNTISELSTQNIKINPLKVDSHSGIEGNERADTIAKELIENSPIAQELGEIYKTSKNYNTPQNFGSYQQFYQPQPTPTYQPQPEYQYSSQPQFQMQPPPQDFNTMSPYAANVSYHYFQGHGGRGGYNSASPNRSGFNQYIGNYNIGSYGRGRYRRGGYR